MEPAVKEALGEFAAYFELEDNGKIKCLINGHSFSQSKPDQITAFLKGGKFAKLKVRYDAENSLSKYEPFMVVSKNFPHMLYCALTGQLLEKSLASVKRHMGGKRFQRAKARFVADEQELKPEPELSEFGIYLPGKEGAEPPPDDDTEGTSEEGEDAMDEDDDKPPAARPSKQRSKKKEQGEAADTAAGKTKAGKKGSKQKGKDGGDQGAGEEDEEEPEFWIPPDADESMDGSDEGEEDEGGEGEEGGSDVGEEDEEVEEIEEDELGVEAMDEDGDEEPGPSGRGGQQVVKGKGGTSGRADAKQHAAAQAGRRAEPIVPPPDAKLGKKGKKGKKAVPEAAAPEPASDDFEFGAEDGAQQQPNGSAHAAEPSKQQQVVAASKPKKKNPAKHPAKKARK